MSDKASQKEILENYWKSNILGKYRQTRFSRFETINDYQEEILSLDQEIKEITLQADKEYKAIDDIKDIRYNI